jgi:hypothetical protein
MHFPTENEVISPVTHISIDTLSRGFNEWIQRLRERIRRGGDDVEPTAGGKIE